ncbi:MAG: hypothetical protein AAFN77_07780 [Planctomycetota bacterium]
MKTLIQDIWNQRDLPSALLLVAILLAALWCVALPISQTVQHAYLNRFHLKTEGYFAWAAQQLSPAMYNLENTYVFSEVPLTQDQRNEVERRYFDRREGRQDSPGALEFQADSKVMVDMINHFPTRTMTFAHSRGFLTKHRSGTFYFRSRYRDLELESIFQIKPISDSVSNVVRLPDEAVEDHE